MADEPCPFKVGDRVQHKDEDVGLVGTVVHVYDNGWVDIDWDRWFGHHDQVEPEA
jgi:hypothetical protein